MTAQQQWNSWLEGIPAAEQTALYEVLKSRLNGHTPAIPQFDKKITITRTPTQDLLLKGTPPYLDIFKLQDVFKALAFKSNLLLKGPKGDGKTLSVLTYAQLTGAPIIIQECSEDTKKMDLMGSQTLLGDETIYTLGCIPAAIDVANEFGSCILLFEELSALTPQVQKMLNAVTDFRKQCSMPFLGKTYTLQPNKYLWVVGTMNPSVYGGTYDLNEDLKSRFEELELTYPHAGQEKQVVQLSCGPVMGATMPVPVNLMVNGRPEDVKHVDDNIITMIVKLAGETRQQASGYALSTRDVVRVVETLPLLGLEKALQLVLCKFEGEDDKKLMSARIKSIFGLSMKPFWGGV